MAKLKFIGLFSIMLFSLNSFTQEIRNVRISQEGTNVVVVYDLDGKSSKHYTVNLYYTTDKGKSWRGPVKDVAGDVSYQAPGNNKRALWDATSGNEPIDGAIQFKLTAETTTINDQVAEKNSLSEPCNELKNRSDSRFGTIVEVGYGFVDTDDGHLIALSVIERYRLNPYFAIGVGSGLNIFVGTGATIPLFMDFRTTFRNKKNSPYLALDSGYSIGDLPGFFLKLTPGLSFKVLKKSVVDIGISYEIQEKYYYRYYPEDSLMPSLSLNVGISF